MGELALSGHMTRRRSKSLLSRVIVLISVNMNERSAKRYRLFDLRRGNIMFCTQCGTDNDDAAAFCTSCGEPLNNMPFDSNASSDEVSEASASHSPEAPAFSDIPASAKKSKNPLIIGIIAAVIVVCLVIAGIVWFNMDQAAKAKREPHRILISISAAGYSDADTLIPVQAKGADFEGNAVDELFFVNAAGEGVSLPKGNYELSVPASPLTEDGILYDDDPNVYSVEVPEDTENDEDVDASSEASIILEKSTALDETQEMIDRAIEYADKNPDQASKASELAAKAQQVHDDAVAAKRHEEEVAQARQNPSSVNAMSGAVTLKGRLVRENLTTEETGMGWALVNYVLQFDTPVTITYPGPSGQATTNTFSKIQVGGKEIYIASNPNANSAVNSESIPDLQRYVGQYVAVTGSLYDSGNFHTFGNARFRDYSISELPS